MEIMNGIDIIEVDRIKESIDEYGDAFLNRIYTKNEQEYCNESKKMKYQRYAARFAAKEAVFKAISKHISNMSDVSWNKIEILNEESGKPIANLEKLNLKNIQSMDLSISHLDKYAVASFSIIFDK